MTKNVINCNQTWILPAYWPSQTLPPVLSAFQDDACFFGHHRHQTVQFTNPQTHKQDIRTSDCCLHSARQTLTANCASPTNGEKQHSFNDQLGERRRSINIEEGRGREREQHLHGTINSRVSERLIMNSGWQWFATTAAHCRSLDVICLRFAARWLEILSFSHALFVVEEGRRCRGMGNGEFTHWTNHWAKTMDENKGEEEEEKTKHCIFNVSKWKLSVCQRKGKRKWRRRKRGTPYGRTRSPASS